MSARRTATAWSGPNLPAIDVLLCERCHLLFTLDPWMERRTRHPECEGLDVLPTPPGPRPEHLARNLAWAFWMYLGGESAREIGRRWGFDHATVREGAQSIVRLLPLPEVMKIGRSWRGAAFVRRVRLLREAAGDL